MPGKVAPSQSMSKPRENSSKKKAELRKLNTYPEDQPEVSIISGDILTESNIDHSHF